MNIWVYLLTTIVILLATVGLVSIGWSIITHFDRKADERIKLKTDVAILERRCESLLNRLNALEHNAGVERKFILTLEKSIDALRTRIYRLETRQTNRPIISRSVDEEWAKMMNTMMEQKPNKQEEK